MPYTISEVSRVEKIMASGLEVTRVLDVSPYTARGQAYSDLLGGVRLVGGRMVRIPPMYDPAFPWCRVAEITTECVEDDYQVAPTANYNRLRVTAPYSGPARMTVVYRTPEGGQTQSDIDSAQGQGTAEAQEIDLADESWDFSNTQVPIPNTSMVWERTDGAVGGTLPPGSVLNPAGSLAVRKLIPKLDYALVRKFVVRKPTNAVLTMLGRVNKSAIVLSGDRYLPETLRFDAASVRRSITNLGIKFYEVTYKFCCNPIYDTYWKGPGPNVTATGYVGWNRFYSFERDRFEYLTNPRNQARRVYQFDEDTPSQRLGNRVVRGFNLLFNPYAF